jgi:hypothetical protein
MGAFLFFKAWGLTRQNANGGQVSLSAQNLSFLLLTFFVSLLSSFVLRFKKTD